LPIFYACKATIRKRCLFWKKYIELDPEDFDPYLGIISIQKQLGESISAEHLEKTRRYLPADNWYCKACLESVCNNPDLAFEHLAQAAQKGLLDPSWAWKDPDLVWIRNDPRFTEIVGPNPKTA
jgi:hypothetical protein